MLREAAEQTGDAVGDGTSTATILAHAIYADGLRNVAAGASAIDLNRGLDRGLKVVVDSIKALSRPVASVILEMLESEVNDRPAAIALTHRAMKAQEEILRHFQEVREYSGPMKLDQEVCDLGAIARSAWAQLANRRKDRNISFDLTTYGLNLD